MFGQRVAISNYCLLLLLNLLIRKKYQNNDRKSQSSRKGFCIQLE